VIHKSTTVVNDGDTSLITNPISEWPTWPDWFAENDEIVHIGSTSVRGENGAFVVSEGVWPALFNTNYPDGWRNVRVKRKMLGDDTLRITFGSGVNVVGETTIVDVYARILVSLA